MSSERVPHGAKAAEAMAEHATLPLPVATVHSSPPKKKAVMQSRALIKGMVGLT